MIVNSGDEEGSSTDYAKMAVALGNTIKHGIKVNLVNINESLPSFSPNAEENYISYGFRSLTGIGYDVIQKILDMRPFSNFKDFMERVQPNKAQALSLIKAGAFTEIEDENRRETIAKYAKFQTTNRKNLTIAQIPLLAEAELIPDFLNEEYRIYEFNRYVKEILIKSGQVIRLDQRAENFLNSMGYDELITDFDNWTVMGISEWDKVYQKRMDAFRNFFKENKQELLQNIFWVEMMQLFESYGGLESYAKWEMESMSFYYSEHELKNVDTNMYGIKKFSKLPSSPRKVNPNAKYSRFILSSIIGTVIGKNKTKGSIDLLTPEGDVILVKMYKGDFSHWDKRISERTSTGKKTVVENSFFERGNKIYVTGFRRDDQFRPKTYSDTPTPQIGLITNINEDGSLEFKTSRA